MEGSPIADEALEELAERVSSHFRVVRLRAPKEVRRRVQGVLDRVYTAVHGEGASIRERVAIMRQLEVLEAELRGRVAFVPQLYRDGRLGVIRLHEPIRIREAVDDRRIRRHIERYEARVLRAEDRMRWFFERAGLEVEKKREPRPWELPYSEFDAVHELLWRRVSRTTHT